MALRFKELQSVAKKAIDEERTTQALTKEVRRVLGPSAYVNGSLQEVAEAAIYRLDVLERTGRALSESFDRKMMVQLSKNTDATVRKLAARALPLSEAAHLARDPHPDVRIEVAKKLPIRRLKEMSNLYPGDDGLAFVLQRRLQESGLPQPEIDDEEFDLHGGGRLTVAKQHDGPELSDAFYRTLAKKIIHDYSGNLENTWEEIAVHRHVASVRATSLVDIDEGKLYKEVKKLMRDREDMNLKKAQTSLKEVARRLRYDDHKEYLSEALEEDRDTVAELLESGLTPSEYLSQANSLFNIKESTLPPGIRKYKLAEGQATSMRVPCVGRLPGGTGFRSVDERALDAYCRHWTDRQALQGEPLRLEWSTHPDEVGKFSFNVVLR